MTLKKTTNESIEVDFGSSVDLTGATVFFTAKKNMSDLDAAAVIKKDVTSHSDPTHGKTVITLTTSDTNVPVGNYFWDIRIKDASGNITNTEQEILKVAAVVTQRTS